MNIGNWTRRERGKWHLVESVIEEAAITKCGRRMEARTGDGELQVSDVMPLTRMIGQPQNCKRCDTRVAVTVNVTMSAHDVNPEDDPAVGQVDPE